MSISSDFLLFCETEVTRFRAPQKHSATTTTTTAVASVGAAGP